MLSPSLNSTIFLIILLSAIDERKKISRNRKSGNYLIARGEGDKRLLWILIEPATAGSRLIPPDI
jgi:hypothetical protein